MSLRRRMFGGGVVGGGRLRVTTELAVIPFLNLAQTNRRLAGEIGPLWSAMLSSAGFIGGPHVAAFERDFAEFTGSRHAVGVANGTDAIMIALQALGVRHGDEVIAPAHTFVATVEAIERAGAVPVLADVDRATATLHPESIAERITERTAAVIPVHLYGQPADMDPIREVASKHGLAVLEDAAQAHGATYKGYAVGSLGDAAAFSFYPGKNLGACGDAGAVTTQDDDGAELARIIANHGQSAKYHHVVSGVNSRLDAVQAVALSVKLGHLPKWNHRRREIADQYARMMEGLDLALPVIAEDRTHVFHLYVIRHPKRDRLLHQLTEMKVGVGLHYPTPVHLHPAFEHLGYGPGDFPESEAWAAECLSLPMCPELTDHQVEAVVQRLAEAV